jgi:hypothetical protein
MENAMSDWNPEDRALLDLARDGHEPTHGDRARVRLALLLRLGVGTGLAGTTAATSKAASALVLIKVVAAIAVAGAISGTGVVTYRMIHPSRGPVVITSMSSPQPTGARAPGRGPVADTPQTDMTDRVIEAQPAPEITPPAHPTRPSSDESMALAVPRTKRSAEPIANQSSALASPLAEWPADPPSVPPQEAAIAPSDAPRTSAVIAPPDAPRTSGASVLRLPPTTLEAETRLVRSGVAALHAGDAARALALFEEHARAFPTGALAEERAAERVVALGDLRRCDEARAAASDFLRDHPHSPLAARVRESCAHAPNP